MGRESPANHMTGISPTCMYSVRFERMIMSPREKAGSIEPDVTTRTGLGDFAMQHNVFHAMNSVAMQRTDGSGLESACLVRPRMWESLIIFPVK